ncbi:DUF6768 family protein [Pseudoroseicyclus sp. CXY001]|uniref:DUF6768 family protein n=1 Tax=Pseudoroseicyclus sp. CXY001 TaxID=3242492 RepID=UPI0035712E8D
MSKIDDLIREALEGEDRQMAKELEEAGWFRLAFGLFRGPLGWVTWVLMVVQTVMFVAGGWCAVKFFGTEELLPAIRWGISGAVLWLMAVSLKLSLMPQIQADRVIREIRRLELVMARRES